MPRLATQAAAACVVEVEVGRATAGARDEEGLIQGDLHVVDDRGAHSEARISRYKAKHNRLCLLLCALYANCPYYSVLYMQCVLII